MCACYEVCKKVVVYTRFISAYWVSRALIQIGVAAGGFAIYVVRRGT